MQDLTNGDLTLEVQKIRIISKWSSDIKIFGDSVSFAVRHYLLEKDFARFFMYLTFQSKTIIIFYSAYVWFWSKYYWFESSKWDTFVSKNVFHFNFDFFLVIRLILFELLVVIRYFCLKLKTKYKYKCVMRLVGWLMRKLPWIKLLILSFMILERLSCL